MAKERLVNCNDRNLRISRVPLKSQAPPGHQLIHERWTNQKGFPKGSPW